jgi:hypothetical protein
VLPDFFCSFAGEADLESDFSDFSDFSVFSAFSVFSDFSSFSDLLESPPVVFLP